MAKDETKKILFEDLNVYVLIKPFINFAEIDFALMRPYAKHRLREFQPT